MGFHVHDDLIETTGARRSTRTSGGHAGFGRDSTAFLSTDFHAQANRASIISSIRARQFGLEAVRSWGETRTSTPTPWRRASRRRRSSLRAGDRSRPPRPVRVATGAAAGQARATASGAAGDLRQVGIDTWRGVSFIDVDLPRAFANVDDMPAWRSRRCVRQRCRPGAYVTDLENDIRPRPRARSARARSLRAKLAWRKASRCRSIACWRSRRAARRDAGRFRQAAGRERRRSGSGVAQGQTETSAAGALIPTAREQLDELHTFLSRSPVMSVPERHHHRRQPRCFRWSSASMWAPGPFNRNRRARCIYRRRSEVGPIAERAPARLQPADIWAISIHGSIRGTSFTINA